MKLERGTVYRLKTGELAVLSYFSQTGKAVFHPVGEPSLQDCYILDKPEERIERRERQASDYDMTGRLL
jgi:hypothetical protein